MKSIKEFARKPQLVELVLDGEDIIAEYGEPITFWMTDYVDINTYFDFFKSQSDNGGGDQLNFLMRKIIKNDQGESVLGEDEALPIDIAVAALTKINETLGKSKTKSLMSETGIPQN
jgi:hypothetical protein